LSASINQERHVDEAFLEKRIHRLTNGAKGVIPPALNQKGLLPQAMAIDRLISSEGSRSGFNLLSIEPHAVRRDGQEKAACVDGLRLPDRDRFRQFPVAAAPRCFRRDRPGASTEHRKHEEA